MLVISFSSSIDRGIILWGNKQHLVPVHVGDDAFTQGAHHLAQREVPQVHVRNRGSLQGAVSLPEQCGFNEEVRFTCSIPAKLKDSLPDLCCGGGETRRQHNLPLRQPHSHWGTEKPRSRLHCCTILTKAASTLPPLREAATARYDLKNGKYSMGLGLLGGLLHGLKSYEGAEKERQLHYRFCPHHSPKDARTGVPAGMPYQCTFSLPASFPESTTSGRNSKGNPAPCSSSVFHS
ncbi:hypothetical protein E2C01_021199 [Portunus trituberculatus]|uniref:Uncharacterized protein n=1 Tax=Portunus trituberculatus TaxID=210409 RepID=A0A5B7E4B9_PORTR|nr:hypothetical protein [Portunus trituberculatus]